jgi:hypothetical protein
MLAQDALNKSGGRSFSIGAGDVDDSIGALGVTKKFYCSSGWFKPWPDLVFWNSKHELL